MSALTDIVEDATVQVTQDTRTNSKNPVDLPAGLKGKVHKIDKDGDALVEFEGFEKKHWIKQSKFSNLSVMGQDMPTTTILEGTFVKVVKEMRTSSKNPVDLTVGSKGKVCKVDKDGDALIAFDGHDAKHWIKKSFFCNLLTSTEVRPKPREDTLLNATNETRPKPREDTLRNASNASNETRPKPREDHRFVYTSAAAEKPFVCSKCTEDKVSCESCWGSGRSCWGCAGVGFRQTDKGAECALCDGLGKLQIKGKMEKCLDCGGSGKDSELCRKCCGTGGEECRKCRGRGRPRCNDCFALFKQATNSQGLGSEPPLGVAIKQCAPADVEALKKLWLERGGRGSVLAAWAIDNPLLSWRLRRRQQEFREQNAMEADELQGFHGTPAQNVLAISQNGFDASRRSGQVYGAGEYFAKCPEVSRSYCRGDSYMILCRLLLGTQTSSQQLGDGDHIWVPSMSYYVISSPEQVVPLYILKFNAKQGTQDLERALSYPVWSTLEQVQVQTIPDNRPCAMTAQSTDALWLGYLHPQHSDSQLEQNIDKFLKENLPSKYMNQWQICIVRGKYTQAKVRLQIQLPQALVKNLNEAPFIEAGSKRTITVDDSHGSRGARCPRSIAQFCRGRNLRFVDPCWCDHAASPTSAASFTLTPIELTSARGDEIVSKFMASAPFHDGTPKICGIKAINNPILNNLHERFRKYLADKNKEEPKMIELFHGTNINILEILYTNGLQPPSDTSPAEDCPVSGGKGLCTSICDNRCEKCTEKHHWNKCHMFGLGIYLADIAQKSHRYVSQPIRTKGGKRRCRMVLCSVVMGRTLMIEGHLRKGECMHDVPGLRTVWKGELEAMV